MKSIKYPTFLEAFQAALSFEKALHFCKYNAKVSAFASNECLICAQGNLLAKVTLGFLLH